MVDFDGEVLNHLRIIHDASHIEQPGAGAGADLNQKCGELVEAGLRLDRPVGLPEL